MDGDFTGTAAGAGTFAPYFVSANNPGHALNGCIQPIYRTSPGDAGNRLQFGDADPSDGGCDGGIFTGAEVYNFEQKLGDDLQARAGRIVTGGGGASCYSGQTYNLSAGTAVCHVEILIK